MLLWRISEFADLSGAGGTLASGRWSTRGPPIVYSAESSALALLEVLVRASIGRPPDDYQLLRIEADDDIARTEYPKSAVPALDQSRAWGDAWLSAGETALARVPSAIAPFSYNMLINPEHPDAAAIRVAAHGRWPWDRRLFKASG